MYKKFLGILILIIAMCICVSNCALSDESDDWSSAWDAYTSDGLDRPVNAVEFKKTMDELKKYREKNEKNKKLKKGEMPPPTTFNAPVEIERNDIVKITQPLYYDGKTVPVGFYKIVCEEEGNNHFFKLMQGKTPIIKIVATKTSHMSFCPNKVSCLETEIYQDKYFKINYKTLEYAVTGYLAIVK